MRDFTYRAAVVLVGLVFILIGAGFCFSTGQAQAPSRESFSAEAQSETPEATSTPIPTPEEPQMIPTAESTQAVSPESFLFGFIEESSPVNEVLIGGGPEDQHSPALAYNASEESYLVVWLQTGEPTSFYGRFILANGIPLTQEFPIVEGSVGEPQRPELVYNEVDNGYLLAWYELNGDVSVESYCLYSACVTYEIPRANLYALKISADGIPTSSAPTLITTEMTDFDIRSEYDIAFNSNSNEYLMVWAQPPGGFIGNIAHPHRLMGQRLDSSLNILGSPVVIKPIVASDIRATYSAGSNEYLVTNSYFMYGSRQYDLYAQRLDPVSLSNQGSSITFTFYLGGWQTYPGVAYDSVEDNYLLTWHDNPTHPPGFGHIQGQLIQAGTGSRLGSDFLVMESIDGIFYDEPRLAHSAIEDRYVVMGGVGTAPDLTGQYVSSSGVLEDGPFTVSTSALLGKVVARDGDIQSAPSWFVVWVHFGDVYGSTLTPPAQASIRVLTEDGLATLPWDGLVNDTLVVEAIVYDEPRPEVVTTRVTAEQSNKVTTLALNYVYTGGDGGHVYRISRDADQFISESVELTAAAVVNAHDETEYGIAWTYINDLVGTNDSFHRGIAWGEGDEGTNRPPASLEYFKAGGFENAKVELVMYDAVPDEFFIKNQADVLLYIGEGWHDDNYLYLLNRIEDENGNVVNPGEIVEPSDLDGSWESVDVPIFFGCSVLDINNLNNWDIDPSSPGLKWVEEVPGPQIWLGFQFSAPQIINQKGYEILYALADEFVGKGESWVDAWEHATSGDLTTYRASGAVAINLIEEDGVYYYWHEVICIKFLGCLYNWRSVDRSEWMSSSSGLDALIASPAEVHIYDYAGRHTGPTIGGGYDMEIPGSEISTTEVSGELADAGDSQALRTSILTADLSQLDSIILVGTDIGTFDFVFNIPDRLNGIQYKVAFIDVPVSPLEVFIIEPDADTEFVMMGSTGMQIPPTEISIIPLDLPVNLTIEGVAIGYTVYQSDVSVILGGSISGYLPTPTAFEYDLGDGWQTYQEPLTLTINGEYVLRYRGIFEDGNYDVVQETVFSIQKPNYPPIADAGPDQVVEEGITVTLSAESSMDPDDDPITFDWELIDNTGPEVLLSSTTDTSPTFFAPDDGILTFQVTVTDSQGASDVDQVMVTINNRPPVTGDINAPLAPVLINTLMTTSAGFTDAGILDLHVATWDWGDGSESTGTVVEESGQGFVTGEHTYVESGIYTIQLTVTDEDEGFSTSTFHYVVVYDPYGEFVTGGGWINSLIGAYALDPAIIGKANFGFNAKYRSGETIPNGQTQFGLHDADFIFHSIEYEWLVISGDHAIYQGTGTVNKEGGYGFRVSLIDGDSGGDDDIDRFRIRIWNLENGDIVYDSQMGDPIGAPPTELLGGGSIVIH